MPTVERKLAAILSADVAGYSRLMAEDEAGTIQTLKSYRDLMRTLIRQHAGRVVDAVGDNLLADFPSVVDAVGCAVEIQKELAERNEEAAEGREMLCRIGINLGDVVVEEDGIYGDGVNIAARVEALAEPGGIAISGTAFDHVQGKLGLEFEDLGEQNVKNIPRTVRVYGIMGSEPISRGRRQAPARDIRSSEESGYLSEKSVAVLRFTDMSFARDQSALCEGISEEILNKLAQIQDMKVIARTSSFLFDSNATPIREIGRRLGVRNVLEGSVRLAGDQVRITAQLIECESEFHRWSQTYTRGLEDIFALYDDIASEILRELKVVMVGEGMPRPVSPPTHSVAAHNLLLQARFKFAESSEARDAFPLLEQALELDPGYAEAHSLKSLLLLGQAEMGRVPAEQGYVAAREAAAKALEIDPGLVSAHLNMGLIHERLDLDFRLAAESYREAERLGALPNAHLLMSVGRYREALEIFRQGEQLDPANAMSKLFVGRALRSVGRMDGASAKFEEALKLVPRNTFVLVEILRHYIYEARDFDQAARVIEESKGSGQILRWGRAAIAAEQGDQRDARALVEEWVRHRDTRYVSASFIEFMFYRLGDYEQQIRWFAIKEKEKDGLSQVLDFLRDTPDYWDELREWALSEPETTRDRLQMIDEHRARIDRITERMVL
jgi:adenylate cyclase